MAGQGGEETACVRAVHPAQTLNCYAARTISLKRQGTIHGEYLSLHRAVAHRERVTTVDTLKALSLDNCKFANVVVLSTRSSWPSSTARTSTDGDKAILNKIAKVDGVVQTNIIAVVRPVKGDDIPSPPGDRLCRPSKRGGEGGEQAAVQSVFSSIPVDEAFHALMLGAMDV